MGKWWPLPRKGLILFFLLWENGTSHLLLLAPWNKERVASSLMYSMRTYVVLINLLKTIGTPFAFNPLVLNLFKTTRTVYVPWVFENADAAVTRFEQMLKSNQVYFLTRWVETIIQYYIDRRNQLRQEGLEMAINQHPFILTCSYSNRK